VPREVTLGQSTDDRIEVLSGLREGETVVTSATFLVDAESNLGSALGGMANMPGMDVTTPPQRLAPDAPRATPVPAAPSDTAMADMPGMHHGGDSAKRD
jgi:membrane fusion protein, copper/silver efflux system